MVESIVPLPEQKTVHVKLGYQASITNAISKLGTLAGCVSVSKLNSHIAEEEYGELEKLRRHFGIGLAANPPDYATIAAGMVPNTKRRGGAPARPRLFPQRPSPYKPKKVKADVPAAQAGESLEIPDTQVCDVTYSAADPQHQYYIGDNSEDQEPLGE